MKKKVLALIAHDNMKKDIVKWARDNKERLQDFELCGTGHTAKLIADEIGLDVKQYLPGPLVVINKLGQK